MSYIASITMLVTVPLFNQAPEDDLRVINMVRIYTEMMKLRHTLLSLDYLAPHSELERYFVQEIGLIDNFTIRYSIHLVVQLSVLQPHEYNYIYIYLYIDINVCIFMFIHIYVYVSIYKDIIFLFFSLYIHRVSH